MDFADYDNDGLPDIVVSDLAYQKYSLYQNNGDGTFAYSSDSTGLGSMTFLHSGWGMRFIDYDNDGWKDLLVAQAHVMDTIELNYPQLHYREPMLLARNTGQGFVDVSDQSGAVFHGPWASRGMAIGDIDNDGRVDAVVTENGGPIHILHNETEHAKSLAHSESRGPQKQSRRYRRGGEDHHRARRAVCDGDNMR